MDIVDLLRRTEGKTLEFKRDLSSPGGALKSIIAFANTAGGTLLVGVEDRTRRVIDLLEPLAHAAFAVLPAANPIGELRPPD